MPRTLPLLCLLCLLAPPAPAQDGGQVSAAPDKPPPASGPPPEAAPASPVVRVVPARALIGVRLLDAAGAPLGEVRMLMIDLAEARVRYLLVRDAGEKADRLRPVPWPLVAPVVPDGPLRSRVVQDALATPPLFPSEQLAKLTTPATMAAIAEFYGHEPTPASPGGAPATPGRPHLVVGRDVVTVTAPELPYSPGAVHDVVRAGKGQGLGHVDEVMLDAVGGNVAFVLVARGGLLGLGESWMPVPLPALDWDGESGAFVLRAEAAKGDSFDKRPPPAGRVSRQDLTELYRRYEVAPYWQ